ncbi:hypothetical protein [Algibacter pectinivorans]|uniref:O-antigen ligase like membrane protein n=1 Tax=Algibacter pectinivorans TaxID=870482 RepID=A0A1I1NE55_9FLAO|nr:hypothetical protein [Algibacter pectinivorans]SFC96004.1 hypothetical protein SAMN04487987_102240 [Algibacter pectinivorans]
MRILVARYTLLKASILWCFFCSFILALFYNFFNPDINILFLKDLIIIGILFVSLKFSVKVNVFTFSFFLFLAYLFITALLTDATIMAIVASIRQMVVPYILFLVGLNLATKKSENTIKKYVFYLALIVVVFGFIEITFNIWHYLDVTNYFEIKNIPIYNKTYKDFYNYPDFFIEPMFGGIKRMTSTLLDPINLGHVLTFIIALLIYDKELVNIRWRKGLIIVFLIASSFTFCKGAWLQLIILAILVTNKISKTIKYIIVGGIMYSMFLIATWHHGAREHLEGLMASLEHISIFGVGLARTGNQAYLYGIQEVKIGDTYFGAILGQIGVVGYFLWVAPFMLVMKKLEFNLISKIFLSQLFISLLSENSFNLLSVFLVCIFLGLEYRKYLDKVYE